MSRGIRKWWALAPGAPGKGPKIVLKNFFENLKKKRIFESTYMVGRCRRRDWYILLRTFGKIEQVHFVSTPPS